MLNRDFLKFGKLKEQLNRIYGYCPQQYFAVNKCQGSQTNPKKCKYDYRQHVERYQYPCIHYFTGNCKYGMNCHFSHNIRRQIMRPEPNKDTCRKLYFENKCPLGGKCKFSHDLKQYPCYYNSVSKCRFSSQDCFYSHQKYINAPLICFFNLMKDGCKNKPEDCQNSHIPDFANYLSYDGPIN